MVRITGILSAVTTLLFLGLALLGGSSLAEEPKKNAEECIDAVRSALQHSYAALGDPAVIDSHTLGKIVEGAKGDLRKLVWGDPDVRVTTSVLSGKIKIWASCSGEELWGEWVPSKSQ